MRQPNIDTFLSPLLLSFWKYLILITSHRFESMGWRVQCSNHVLAQTQLGTSHLRFRSKFCRRHHKNHEEHHQDWPKVVTLDFFHNSLESLESLHVLHGAYDATNAGRWQVVSVPKWVNMVCIPCVFSWVWEIQEEIMANFIIDLSLFSIFLCQELPPEVPLLLTAPVGRVKLHRIFDEWWHKWYWWMFFQHKKLTICRFAKPCFSIFPQDRQRQHPFPQATNGLTGLAEQTESLSCDVIDGSNQ